VRYRYGELDLDLIQSLLAAEELLKLFQELVLRSGGDVQEAMDWMRQLQIRGLIRPDFDLDVLLEALLERGIVAPTKSGGLALGVPGERMIRKAALDEIFGSLKKSGAGEHRVPPAGAGQERLPETRSYRFGDPVESIDGKRSLENALRRSGGETLLLTEEDLEVSETEHLSSCATVVAIDISHSMILYGEDRFTPAKKVALALVELIQSKYPKDTIDVVLFGDEASVVPLTRLSSAQVGPFHTNTKAGLELAAGLLRHRKHTNKQIFMVTDGKPSCISEGGGLYKNPFGLDLKIVNRTLEAAERCRRDDITITTFMLATDPALVNFVDQLTRIARGRAYFASPGNLAEFILADYVRNRRKRIH